MTSHHTGHGFIDWLLHGFAWRIGSDAANAIFHAAPGLILPVVLVVLVFFGVRWLLRRNQS
ncbi:hypothetical protein AWC32_16740 [Mycobacterium xenopi]|nr:hypothetical protein AWC32_16740 [Mycobacterium xenopi]SPX94893.1 Uncharacterised protein [Mycobacterium xenopi]